MPLKQLLGEELYNTVSEALKGKGKDGKDIELVIGNDGSYVPAAKYDDLKSQHSAAEATLKTVSESMKDLGGTGDAEKLSDDIKAAKQRLADIETNHQTEIVKMKKTAAVKRSLASQLHDPNDLISQIDLEKIELDDNDDLKSDLTDTLKPYRESKPYLFKEADKKPEVRGAVPADTKKEKQEKKITGSVFL